jgi:hypothetical protein
MRTALTYRDSKHESFYAFHKSTFVFKKAFPISGKSELNPKIVSSRNDAESIFATMMGILFIVYYLSYKLIKMQVRVIDAAYLRKSLG